MNGNELQQHHITARQSLKAFTQARIALGSTGVSEPLAAALQFRMAHAHARDAVYSMIDVESMQRQLEAQYLSSVIVQSKAQTRQDYIRRPDLGRVLHENSAAKLALWNDVPCDISIAVADGLSAHAVNMHALPLLQILIPQLLRAGLILSPIVLVQQGRVAIADETGHILRAKLSLILIGERPGLSAADSMGAYLTYNPRPGLTDECRNCISNIRPNGLPLEMAAHKAFHLIREAMRLQLTGVQLKDESLPLNNGSGTLPEENM